jgi:hypothetical protein
MPYPYTPCGRATLETALRPSSTPLDTPRHTPMDGATSHTTLVQGTFFPAILPSIFTGPFWVSDGIPFIHIYEEKEGMK